MILSGQITATNSNQEVVQLLSSNFDLKKAQEELQSFGSFVSGESYSMSTSQGIFGEKTISAERVKFASTILEDDD